MPDRPGNERCDDNASAGQQPDGEDRPVTNRIDKRQNEKRRNDEMTEAEPIRAVTEKRKPRVGETEREMHVVDEDLERKEERLWIGRCIEAKNAVQKRGFHLQAERRDSAND